mmetsp:Transcript_9582/g.16547  ORF Transcript_9582/g.16547 Transcript_9582/m.16547 type:complete len:205 (+) Transcript_9582:102-716(+)
MQLPEVWHQHYLQLQHRRQVWKPWNCICGATIFCLGTNFQSWSCRDPQWLSGSSVLQAAAPAQHPREEAISMELPLASECEASTLTCFRGSLQLVLEISTMTTPMLQTSSNHVFGSAPYTEDNTHNSTLPTSSSSKDTGLMFQSRRTKFRRQVLELLPPTWVNHWELVSMILVSHHLAQNGGLFVCGSWMSESLNPLQGRWDQV